MAAPPTPPSLDQLDGKHFSFYPPIVGIEHNEWTRSASNWSEILVVNARSGQEIWISKRYLGEVSRTDEPVLIVGLNRELEYRGGMLCPYQKRVLPMPGAPAAAPAQEETGIPEKGHWMEMHGIRLEGNDKRTLKLIGFACACFIGIYLAFVGYNNWDNIRFASPKYVSADTAYQELSGRDDYFAIIHKLGQPGAERTGGQEGSIQFQALHYPKRHYTILLMGPDIKTMVYIGAMDDQWRPIHSVRLAGSTGTTDSLLRGLKRF